MDWIKPKLVKLKYTIIIFLPLLSIISCDNQNDNRITPNIIVILADDMGYSDLGITGAEIFTPNLDDLAKNGVLFLNCYNTSRCNPSRASLLTGLYSHKAGVGHMDRNLGEASYQGYIHKNVPTIAEVFRDNGYRTIMTGKWHVGNDREHWPDKRGFERFYGIPAGGGLYFYPTQFLDRPIYRNQEQIFPDSTTFYSTNDFTTEAISFIKESVEDEMPFFAYLAYIAPHFPLQALPEDIEKYNGIYDEGHESIRKRRFEKQKKSGIISSENDISLPDFPLWESIENKEEEIRKMQVYAAQVDRLDQNMGILIKELKNLGVYENTIIVFLSDNGATMEEVNRSPDAEIGSSDSFASYGKHWANVSNTPFRAYKSQTFEGGIRTPLIFSWPNSSNAKEKILNESIHIIDVMPSLLDLANIPLVNQKMDGSSFMGVINGTDEKIHRDLYWEHQGNKAVWNNGYKLVQMHGENWELYDLKSDPYESNELKDSELVIKDSLEQMWNKWASKSGVEEWPITKSR